MRFWLLSVALVVAVSGNAHAQYSPNGNTWTLLSPAVSQNVFIGANVAGYGGANAPYYGSFGVFAANSQVAMQSGAVNITSVPTVTGPPNNPVTVHLHMG